MALTSCSSRRRTRSAAAAGKRPALLLIDRGDGHRHLRRALALHGDFDFRHSTGDVGVLDDRGCPCGRGLPLLKEIQGRTTDFVVAADGTAMHGLALIYVLRDLSGIRQFKIVQESLDLTRVLIVPSDGLGAQAEATIRAKFRQRLGDEVQIVVERVADIPVERSGKFRYVVSNVAPGVGTSFGARVRPIAA